MNDLSYLQWLVENTPTTWWHDSGDPDEFAFGISHGATGVTTNPVLTSQALYAQPNYWKTHLEAFDDIVNPEDKVAALMRSVALPLANQLKATYLKSQGNQGYVCAQVNPAEAGNRAYMMETAREYHKWAPNIAVKLPVTAAGLDILEECIAEGITITATVSFTVPQVIAIAERHRKGTIRARQSGRTPGHCFAVIMIGRIDDYLRDVAWDSNINLTESDIRCAGLAISKRAYEIYKTSQYEAVLLVAALRGNYHMTGLAGAKIIMSIHPKYQALLLEPGVPRESGIDQPVESAVIKRLQAMPEFVRAYEPEGMVPDEFITYGVTQKTLSQFYHVGWAQLENYQVN
jgi:transaldolase